MKRYTKLMTLVAALGMMGTAAAASVVLPNFSMQSIAKSASSNDAGFIVKADPSLKQDAILNISGSVDFNFQGYSGHMDFPPMDVNIGPNSTFSSLNDISTLRDGGTTRETIHIATKDGTIFCSSTIGSGTMPFPTIVKTITISKSGSGYRCQID